MNSPIDQAIDYLLESSTPGVQLEVLAVLRKATAIAFQNRKMDQFSFSESQQLGVRVLDGKHEGVAYSESLDRDSLDEMLNEAKANARWIEKEWVSELQGAIALPELHGLYNSELEDVTVRDKIENAALLEAAALEYDPAITSVAYTRYSDASTSVWIANNKGLRGHYKQSNCVGYTYCLAKDGDNQVMGGEVRAQRGFRGLDPQAIARQAATKALARRGARRPATGKYTVVFENRVAESLIGLITDYFSAKAIDEDTSPLKGKLGRKLFSKALSLIDDPFYVAAAGSRPFDEEGYAARQTNIVESGVVTSFLTNSVYARKLKLAHTASASRSPSTELSVGPSNIRVSVGKKSLNELLQSGGPIILVTNILGFAGFRHASGDFSIPMEGQLYENGKCIAPLKDFLISGNILQLFANVEEVGSDALAPVGAVVCPSLLVRDLTVAGKSSTGS